MKDLFIMAAMGVVALFAIVWYIEREPSLMTPSPEVLLIEEAAVQDRDSCDAIRGTEYQSDSEQRWFLDSCIYTAPVVVKKDQLPAAGIGHPIETGTCHPQVLACWTDWTIDSSICPEGLIQIEVYQVDGYRPKGSTRGVCGNFAMSSVGGVQGAAPCRATRSINIYGDPGWVLAC